MPCAGVTLPSKLIRDALLSRYRQCKEPPEIGGTCLDVKENFQKLPNGLRESVPNAIFVAWDKYSGEIDAEDLAMFFDEEVRPHLQPQCPGQLSSQAAAGAAEAGARASMTATSSKSSQSSGGTIVALRLTRMSRSPEVTNALLTSPLLESCRKRVIDQGLELAPAWACGAKVLVPLPHAYFIQPCFELKHHHVIAFTRDMQFIQSALRGLPCKARPRIAKDHRFANSARRWRQSGGVAGQCPDIGEGFHVDTEKSFDVDFVIEHEFDTDSSVPYSC